RLPHQLHPVGLALIRQTEALGQVVGDADAVAGLDLALRDLDAEPSRLHGSDGYLAHGADHLNRAPSPCLGPPASGTMRTPAPEPRAARTATSASLPSWGCSTPMSDRSFAVAASGAGPGPNQAVLSSSGSSRLGRSTPCARSRD